MCIPAYKYLPRRNRMVLSDHRSLFLIGDSIRTTVRLADIEAAYLCRLGLGIGIEEEFYILCRRDDAVVIPDYVAGSGRLDQCLGALPVTEIVLGRLPHRMWRRLLGLIPTGLPRFAAYPRREIDELIANNLNTGDRP